MLLSLLAKADGTPMNLEGEKKKHLEPALAASLGEKEVYQLQRKLRTTRQNRTNLARQKTIAYDERGKRPTPRQSHM